MADGKTVRAGVRDERQLLQEMASGSRAAAEALVEDSYPYVYAACHRLAGGDGDLAADLTQETYRRAWVALGSFQGRCQFSTWLYRIAYNTWLNHVRGPMRLVPLDERKADPEDPGPGPHASVVGDADAGGIRAAVLQLPDDLRFTVTAHFWGELSVREIAGQEHVTTVAIRKRLHKALGLLAQAIEER